VTWQHAILDIAREEMGHLITVQNLLRVIGGPLTFEREDYPFRSELYPYPFQLEPLSRLLWQNILLQKCRLIRRSRI